MILFTGPDGRSREGYLVFDSAAVPGEPAYIQLAADDGANSKLFDQGSAGLLLQTAQRNRSVRTAFDTAIGEAIYQFVKGADMDAITINAAGFHRVCGNSAVGAGFEKARDFFNKYNTSAYDGSLTLTIGTAPAQTCYLVAEAASWNDPNSRVVNVSFQLVGVPEYGG